MIWVIIFTTYVWAEYYIHICACVSCDIQMCVLCMCMCHNRTSTSVFIRKYFTRPKYRDMQTQALINYLVLVLSQCLAIEQRLPSIYFWKEILHPIKTVCHFNSAPSFDIWWVKCTFPKWKKQRPSQLTCAWFTGSGAILDMTKKWIPLRLS